ncbi:MAG: hypothetical protein IJ313_09875 [Clostridia bacterium]|nr:hypothetical protein [Clostridia bacterium]
MTDNVIRKRKIRETLLLTGMGLFLFACALTAANVLLLPVARTYHGYGAGLTLVSLALYAAICLFVGKKLLDADAPRLERIAKIAVPAYLCVLFAMHLISGALLEYTPSGDNFMIYNAAQLMAKDGNFDAYPDFYLYLSRFSNQWGFMLMLSGLYKLLFALGFADMFFPTVVVQAIIYVFGMLALLSIARRLRGVRGVLSLLLVLCTCFPLYIAAAVLYTDTFSMPFVALALCFALHVLDAKTIKAQIGNSLVCALFAAIGGQVKMTAAIVLIAAAIVFVLRLRAVRALCCCAVIALAMGLSIVGVNKAMVGPVLNPDMVAQHNTPTIHWVMMSIPNGNNPFGDDIEDYRQTWRMMEEGASREEVMDSIYTRLIDKIYYLRYPSRLIPAMIRKNAAAFGDGTLGLSEILDDKPTHYTPLSAVVREEGALYPVYQAVCSGIFIAHLIFAALACLRDMKKKDFRAALLYVAMFGFMVFMLIWEVRSRYIFNFVPVLLLLSMGFIARGVKEEEGKE